MKRSIGGFFFYYYWFKAFASSLLLFVTVLDKIAYLIWEEVLWCVLFTNYIVLVDENKEENLAKLEFCGHELESRDLRVS